MGAVDGENVKERLNNLLHKKMVDQERENKDTKRIDAIFIKQELDPDKCGKDRDANTTDTEISAEVSDRSQNSDSVKEHFLDGIPLHEILNEKKRALLQDREVLKFFSK